MNHPSHSERHRTFYSKAWLYDRAFEFKDLNAENTTLVQLYQKLLGRKPRSFLDIAAGPARNALEMQRKFGIEAHAIDASPEMVAYGLQLSNHERVPLSYIQGDMRRFELAAPVDLAAMFMASTGYLLSNDDMIEHLRSVASNLSSQGVYVLEMTHPRDVFGLGASTSQRWEVEGKWGRLSMTWGLPSDPPFDPIQQTRDVTVRLEYSTPDEVGEIVERATQREFGFQEMRALVELSGVFDWVETLGAWDSEESFSNDKSAFRMIPVLQKKS